MREAISGPASRPPPIRPAIRANCPGRERSAADIRMVTWLGSQGGAGADSPRPLPKRGSPSEVLRVFLRLGLTSFGGPVAHLGYFRAEFVERRRWLDEPAFADIVALCQFLPGPASSQAGISLGILRAGLPGAFAAWLGFTAPSALVMIVFGYA